MVVAYATVSDVEARLGRPISDTLEVVQVEAWLDDVDALILERIPDLAERVADGTPTVATVVAIESNAVIRKIQNPNGVVSEGNDVYNYRLNEDARKGELFLTDEEWARLMPSPVGAAFSTRTYGDADGLADRYPTPWWPESLDWT